jgi:hypothetical protein
VLSLWLGPFLLVYFSGNLVFVWLAFFSIPALWYALRLPQLHYSLNRKQNAAWRWPSLFNMVTFLVSFVVDGLLIVTLGAVLLHNNPDLSGLMITSLVAGYLVYRRACLILFSPLGGLVAGRVGFRRVFNGSALLVVAGLLLMLAGMETIGLVVIFAFNSVNSAIAPVGSSENDEDKIRAAATNANWRDIGAATGAFAGGLFLSGGFLFETLIITTFIMAGLVMLNGRQEKYRLWN